MSNMAPSAFFSFFLLMFILAGIVYLGANTELIYDKTSTVSEVITDPVVEIPLVLEKPVIVEKPVVIDPIIVSPIEKPIIQSEPDNETICLSIVAKLFSNLNPTDEELNEIERELKDNNCGNN